MLGSKKMIFSIKLRLLGRNCNLTWSVIIYIFNIGSIWAQMAPPSPLIAAPQPPCQFNPNQAPEMMFLQGGHFQMGSAKEDEHASKSEMPQHWVAIQPFALSRCEITVAQFRQFVFETGYRTTAERPENAAELASGNTENEVLEGKDSKGEAPISETRRVKKCFSFSDSASSYSSNIHWRSPGFVQDDTHPVTCVSWRDANEFIQWLNTRTGQTYRLPTEAEWEYAARANYSGVFSFSNAFSSPENCQFMNIDNGEICNDGFDYTAPVASFQPNGFGLYDMHGNLWEWTADCWHDNYNNAPVDGSAWIELSENNEGVSIGACDAKSVRGGSWLNVPLLARSAFRLWDNLNSPHNGVGFRVARTL